MLDYTEKEKSLLRKLINLDKEFSDKRDVEEDAHYEALYKKVVSLGYTEREASLLVNDATEIRFDNKACRELFKTE